MTNSGVWIWPTVPPLLVVLAHAVGVGVWLLVVGGWCWYRRWYRRWYRDSLALDLAVAALTLTVFGNLIDRIVAGGARDRWVTPIAVANLADNAHWLALVAVGWELWRFPPARRLAGRSCTWTRADGLHRLMSAHEAGRGTSVVRSWTGWRVGRAHLQLRMAHPGTNVTPVVDRRHCPVGVPRGWVKGLEASPL